MTNATDKKLGEIRDKWQGAEYKASIQQFEDMKADIRFLIHCLITEIQHDVDTKKFRNISSEAL